MEGWVGENNRIYYLSSTYTTHHTHSTIFIKNTARTRICTKDRNYNTGKESKLVCWVGRNKTNIVQYIYSSPPAGGLQRDIVFRSDFVNHV